MGKKSQKFRNFIVSSNIVNYRNASVIIKHFNDSISLFKRFDDIYAAGDEELAAEKLRNAGIYLYQTCEWALKNYLHSRYDAMQIEGTINIIQKTKKIDELSKKEATIYYLIEEFKKEALPSYTVYAINFNDILCNAQLTNNAPKHNATIPDPNKYKRALGEIRKIIKNYIDTNAKLDLIEDSMYGDGNQWYEILEGTSDFSDAFSYILISRSVYNVNYMGLFSQKWDLVIDMDPATDENGLENQYSKLTGATPWIRMLDKIDSKKKFSMSGLPYWIMANGSSDNLDSIAEAGKWKNKYGRYIVDLLEEFHNIYTKPAKVFVFPPASERDLEKIVDGFNDIYDEGKCVDFYVLSPEGEYSRIDSDNFKITSLSFEDFCNNMGVRNKGTKFVTGAIERKLPGENGEFFDISEAFGIELNDSFEVVYIDIDKMEQDDAIKTGKIYFYQGKSEVSWYGLREEFDVIRHEKNLIIDRIKRDMSERGRYLKRICYEPGVGGTTLMRRLAWELRKQYPTLILKKCNEQTSRNIQKLYDITHGQILIFADSNKIEIEEIKNLQFELKRMGFAFLICYMERKSKGVPISDAAVYTVVPSLNRTDAIDMKKKLMEYSYGSELSSILDNIIKGDDPYEKTPFVMAMYTFNREFKGIKPYITNYLVHINDQIKKLLFALALADFGNSSIDIQYFMDIYQDDTVSDFILNNMPGINELIKVENINGKENIRIKYSLFADEILRQISLGKDAENISFVNLVDPILIFIEDSRTNKFNINQDVVLLLRNLFITRKIDTDAEKPVFSPLISKLQEEHRVIESELYNSSNDAIIRIFNKLVEVYPEEPHFTAHLARYYFYIDKNYEKGFENIKTAIELSDNLNGYVDPLLYHMKAMGYSSRINNIYIKEIKKNYREGNKEDNIAIYEKLEEDANEAFALFDKVRKSNVGVAGHISEINMCVSIANMAKDVLDEENFTDFLISDSGNWIIKYVDKATDLWEEVRKIAPENNEDSIEEIGIKIRDLTASIEDSVDLLEDYLISVGKAHTTQVRRLLARAYTKKAIADHKPEDKQKCYQRIVQLMEDNMTEENNHPGNIRMWFETIRYLAVENQESLIMDAIIKLNKWVSLTDSVEAHYYRFVLKFLQAINGSVLAKSELPKLLRELKNKSINLYNRTAAQHWLVKDGEGLDRLMINSRSKKSAVSEDEMANQMLLLNGRISNNYVNESHAYIKFKGIEVYFNPSATKGEIGKTKINQKVKFGIGFSYDGPRAFNSSIKLAGQDDYVEDIRDIESGMILKCEVIKNVTYFTQVRIIGYSDCIGSIHVSELVVPYSDIHRPKIGEIIEIKVLNQKFNEKMQKNIWMLTMNTESAEEKVEKEVTTIEKALRNIKLI